MKTLLKTLVGVFFTVAIAGCASQKEASRSADPNSVNNKYVKDNTKGSEKSNICVVEQEPKIHIVQKGESLWVIAKKYGVTVQAIAEANNIENRSLIKVNQKLIIPDTKDK